MAGKTGTSQVRRISRSERRSGVIRNEHLPWEKRDHALFIGYAPATRPRCAIAVVIEHGGAGSKAAAPVARDILIAAQRLDSSRLAESGAGVRVAAGRARMNVLDHGCALGRGELTLPEKVLRIRWLFVLAICAAAGVGIVMLYSAAGGTVEPWAIRQSARFGVALGIMLVVAVSGIRLWLRWAYPFYFIALSLLVIVDLVGTIGMGAQRWIDLGIINLQPSEVMKIALVLALARYFHGLATEDVGRPAKLVVPAADGADAGRIGAEAT